jgi:hypothetical protein
MDVSRRWSVAVPHAVYTGGYSGTRAAESPAGATKRRRCGTRVSALGVDDALAQAH